MAAIHPNFASALSAPAAKRIVDSFQARFMNRPRPADPAHEHGPSEDRRDVAHDRARDEHCPPEVYVG